MAAMIASPSVPGTNSPRRRSSPISASARSWKPQPWPRLAALDDAGFRRLFAGSPIKRIGRARFLRNVLIAIGNSGRAELQAAAVARLEDEDALVRGAAVWALSRLMTWSCSSERAGRRNLRAAKQSPRWRKNGSKPSISPG